MSMVSMMSMVLRRRGLGLFLLLAATLACSRAAPRTYLYRLELPAEPSARPPPCEPQARRSLLVGDLRVAAPYDDVGIVYRDSEYRLQRYVYHEWAAPPGELVSDALGDGYAASRAFARVERSYDHDASVDAVLRGRVLALEEVDRTELHWFGHLRLQLELVDAEGGERLWSHEYDLTVPLVDRSPSGLAAATSAMLRQVVDASAPAITTALGGPCKR